MMLSFPDIALCVPRILLPRPGTDLTRWAVVACDQYTSQPGYWEGVREFVGDCPSTFNLILPELYLDTRQEPAIAARIQTHMRRYLSEGVLEEQPPGFMLVERTTSPDCIRRGLVVALDLEQYDYRPGSHTLIRATEGTIVERLPPRMRVRREAPLELPHCMVLIDDPGATVIEPLCAHSLEKAYDFELMCGGGHIRGYRVEAPELIQGVARALAALGDPHTFAGKYGAPDAPVLLYAMGDGNHSFATARALWEEIKKTAGTPEEALRHPARYALVELVNLHDAALAFAPIHRVVFNAEFAGVLQQMERFFCAQGCRFCYTPCRDTLQASAEADSCRLRGAHAAVCIAEKGCGVAAIENPELTLEVATLQSFLDVFLREHRTATIDYIHGEGIVSDLATRPGNVGFLIQPLSKSEFFKTVIRDGTLPRKTFSMGEAHEKRYYLECRHISRHCGT
jgi:hypothetical protein